jgi:hypothetical protein
MVRAVAQAVVHVIGGGVEMHMHVGTLSCFGTVGLGQPVLLGNKWASGGGACKGALNRGQLVVVEEERYTH